MEMGDGERQTGEPQGKAQTVGELDLADDIADAVVGPEHGPRLIKLGLRGTIRDGNDGNGCLKASPNGAPMSSANSATTRCSASIWAPV
jgi:hypothetical protein